MVFGGGKSRGRYLDDGSGRGSIWTAAELILPRRGTGWGEKGGGRFKGNSVVGG